MILADKIIEERKRNGWSQEELAEKLGVSRQSVSKWESAQSVPDLQRVIRLAEVFGVSTDYLLKDDYVSGDADAVTAEYQDYEACRQVSMEEANGFIEHRHKQAPMTALGTLLCILSPALLVLLAGFADAGVFGITESFASCVGVIVLLVMVAAAVFIFITSGRGGDEFHYLESEVFETAYGVDGMVRERRREQESSYTRCIAIGVVFCIMACVPLLVAACVDAPDYICCAMVALLLILVGLGVYMIVYVCMIRGAYDILLQEGDYLRNKKTDKARREALSSVYWCLVTAAYLGWSFWTRRWDFTWIIWPVAGVLYGAIAGVCALIFGRKND